MMTHKIVFGKQKVREVQETSPDVGQCRSDSVEAGTVTVHGTIAKPMTGFYSPPIPSLTHLQFTILANVSANNDVAGVQLRQLLTSSLGQTYSGPAFYQLMGRMEEAGLVSGHYVVNLVNETPVKERRYRIEDAGHEALRGVLEFYGAFHFLLPPDEEKCPASSKEFNSSAILKADRSIKPYRRARNTSARRQRVSEKI